MKEEIVEIGGFSYKIRQLPVEEGLPLFNRAASIVTQLQGEITKKSEFAKQISELLEKEPEGVARDTRVAIGLMGEMFISVVSRPDFSDHILAFVKGFRPASAWLKSAQQEIELSGFDFNLHFAGRYRDVYKWVFHCMRVNFGDDFLALFESSKDASPESKGKPSQSRSPIAQA